MEFTFKSKSLLVLTIFSIIPGIQASENKRSNASLFAISATAAAIGGTVAYKLRKKYNHLPEKKKKTIRSAVIGTSVGLVPFFCKFRLGRRTSDDFFKVPVAILAPTAAISLYVYSKFKLAFYPCAWGWNVGTSNALLLEIVVDKGPSSTPIGLPIGLLAVSLTALSYGPYTKKRRKRQTMSNTEDPRSAHPHRMLPHGADK